MENPTLWLVKITISDFFMVTKFLKFNKFSLKKGSPDNFLSKGFIILKKLNNFGFLNSIIFVSLKCFFR